MGRKQLTLEVANERLIDVNKQIYGEFKGTHNVLVECMICGFIDKFSNLHKAVNAQCRNCNKQLCWKCNKEFHISKTQKVRTRLLCYDCADNKNYLKKWYEYRYNLVKDRYGSSCLICGYNRCFQAIAFHHLIPHKKESGPSKIIRSFTPNEIMFNELDKCIPVCKNCHDEIHYNHIFIPPYIRYFDNFVKYKTDIKSNDIKIPVDQSIQYEPIYIN
jgi:hypothetical protein